MLFYENAEAFIAGEKARLERLTSLKLPDRGKITRVLGPADNQDKTTNVARYSITQEVGHLEVDALGIKGDRHRRAHRPSTGREKTIYRGRVPIREHRHLFAVSSADCRTLSRRIGVEATPELLGANLVIERADEEDYSLSALPINTYMLIAPAGTTEQPRPPVATLINQTLQQGCGITGNTLATRYGDATLTQRFIEASQNNRGIVCSVEYPVENMARLEVGQEVFFRYATGTTP